MPDGRRRERDGRRNGDESFWRGTLLSAALHALAIALVLLAPHRMRAAPPTAYTVEIVDPNALGGKLLAGPIGGGAASRRAVPPPKRAEPPPPPKPEPEQVARAEPPVPEPQVKPEPAKPPPVDTDADAVPLANATPAPQPTSRPTATMHAAVKASPSPLAVVKPKPTVSPLALAKPKPTASPVLRANAKPTASPALRANARPSASPIAVARRSEPSAAPSPATRAGAHANERAPEGDLDSRLAAAIKGVESRVAKEGTPGLHEGGAGGGMGGTERTLDGPAGVGGEGPGGGGTLRGLEFVVYYNQMLTRIKDSWTFVGERADLRVTVRFSILDSGEITDIRLVQRSGDPGYDASVERAVKRASPLGPPPQAYRKDFADVELTFRPADLRRPSG